MYSIQFDAGTPKNRTMTSRRKTGSADRAARLFAGLIMILTPLVSTREIWSDSQMQFAANVVGSVLIASALHFPALCNRHNRKKRSHC